MFGKLKYISTGLLIALGIFQLAFFYYFHWHRFVYPDNVDINGLCYVFGQSQNTLVFTADDWSYVLSYEDLYGIDDAYVKYYRHIKTPPLMFGMFLFTCLCLTQSLISVIYYTQTTIPEKNSATNLRLSWIIFGFYAVISFGFYYSQLWISVICINYERYINPKKRGAQLCIYAFVVLMTGLINLPLIAARHNGVCVVVNCYQISRYRWTDSMDISDFSNHAPPCRIRARIRGLFTAEGFSIRILLTRFLPIAFFVGILILWTLGWHYHNIVLLFISNELLRYNHGTNGFMEYIICSLCCYVLVDFTTGILLNEQRILDATCGVVLHIIVLTAYNSFFIKKWKQVIERWSLIITFKNCSTYIHWQKKDTAVEQDLDPSGSFDDHLEAYKQLCNSAEQSFQSEMISE